MQNSQSSNAEFQRSYAGNQNMRKRKKAIKGLTTNDPKDFVTRSKDKETTLTHHISPKDEVTKNIIKKEEI